MKARWWRVVVSASLPPHTRVFFFLERRSFPQRAQHPSGNDHGESGTDDEPTAEHDRRIEQGSSAPANVCSV